MESNKEKTIMRKDGRFINAGTNEIYRWGHKAQERVESYLEPNVNGFYSMPADGGKYYTIGTSEGKFGEYAKFKEAYLSVNSNGMIWAKVGTEKAEIFVAMVKDLINKMIEFGRSNATEEE
jgi:hypothetical protein